MSTPFHFSPRVPAPPHSTPISASAYILPNRKSLKPPINNPYDKFTQPEFDAWIGGITGALRQALGQADEEQPLSHKDTDNVNVYKPEPYPRYDSIEADESADEGVNDSFAGIRARRATGKGKARDPREGPGFGKGDTARPIEIVSSDEEEEEEVELSVLQLDGDESEEEIEEEEGPEEEQMEEQEGDDGEHDYSETEEPAWQEGQSSARPILSPELGEPIKYAEHEEEYEDEAGEEDDYEDGEEYDEEYDEEDGHRKSSPEVFELISDDEEESAQNMRHQKMSQANEVDEGENEESSKDFTDEESELVYPQAVQSAPYVYGPKSARGRRQPEPEAMEEQDYEEEQDHDELFDDDDDDEIQVIQPTENAPLSHQQPRGFSPDDETGVEIRDPWHGPRVYAEDFYAGGDVPASVNRDVDASQLENNSFEVVDVDEDEELQPLSQDTSFPPETTSPRRSKAEIPDHWSGPRHYAQDYYAGGPVALPENETVDIDHLGPEDDEHVTLDAEEEDLKEAFEDEIQPLDADTTFPPQEEMDEGFTGIPDPWSGAPMRTGDFYTGGDVRTFPGDRVDPSMLSGIGDIDDSIDAFLTPGVLSPNQSDERTSMNEDDDNDNASIQVPTNNYVSAPSRRDEPIPADAEFISIDDSDEEPAQEEKLSPAPTRFEDTIYGSIYDEIEDFQGSEVEEQPAQVDEANDQHNTLPIFEGYTEHPETDMHLNTVQASSNDGAQVPEESTKKNRLAGTLVPTTEIFVPSESGAADTSKAEDTPAVNNAVGEDTNIEGVRSGSIPPESLHEPETVTPDVTLTVEAVEPKDSASPSSPVQPGDVIDDVSMSEEKPEITVSSHADDSLTHSTSISAPEPVVKGKDEVMEPSPAVLAIEEVAVNDVESGAFEPETIDISTTGDENEIEVVQETSVITEDQPDSAELDAISTSNVEQETEANDAEAHLNDATPAIEPEPDHAGVATLRALLTPPSGRTHFPPLSSVPDSADVVDLSPTSAETSFSIEVEVSKETQRATSTSDDPSYIEEDENMLSEEDAIGEEDTDIEVVSVVTTDVEEREKDVEQDGYTVEEPITEGRLTEEPPDNSPGLKAISLEPSGTEDIVIPTEDAVIASEDIPSNKIPFHEVQESVTHHDMQPEPSDTMTEGTPRDAEKNISMEMADEHMTPKVEDKILDGPESKATNPQDLPAHTSATSHGEDPGSQETNSPHTTPVFKETSLPVSVTVSPSLLRSIKQQSTAVDIAEDQHQLPKKNDIQASTMHHHVLSSIEDAFFGPNLPNYFGDLSVDFPSDQVHPSIFESVASSFDPSEENASEVQDADKKPLVTSTSSVVTDNAINTAVDSIPTESSGPVENDSSNQTPTAPVSADVDLPDTPMTPVPSQHDAEQVIPSEDVLPVSKQAIQAHTPTLPMSVPDVSSQILPAPPTVKSDEAKPRNTMPVHSEKAAPNQTFPVPMSIPNSYPYNLSTPGPSIFNFENVTPMAPMLMPDAYPYNMSKPQGSRQIEFPAPSFSMPLTDKTTEVETGSVFGDWEDLEFQYPLEEVVAESKDSAISHPPATDNPVADVTSSTLLEPTVKTTSIAEQTGTIQKSNLVSDDANKASSKEDSLPTEVEAIALAMSTTETSSIKTTSATKRTAAKRKRASSPPLAVAPKQVGQKTKGGRRASKPDRKGKLQDLKQTPEPTSEETIHVRPRPQASDAQAPQTENLDSPVESSNAPIYRMLQPASRASSISSTTSDKLAGNQPSPTTNKPGRPPIHPLPLPQSSLFHAHGKNKKLQPLSNFPPKLAKQMQSQQISLSRVPLIPRSSEPLTTPDLPSHNAVPPSSQKLEGVTPLVIPTSNFVPATNVAHESSPAPATPLETISSPKTPASKLPVPSTQLQSDIITPTPTTATIPEPTPTSTPVPAPAVQTPSHQTKPARNPSFTSSPVTRSHCRYHRISLPKEEGGPRVCFLVPGCSLNNKELMEEEEIEDHGDATVEDSYRMIKDLESLEFSSDLIGVLRQLVGLDILREQEVFYLPQPREEIVYRKNSLKKSASEKSAMVRVPADSSSYAGSPGYSNSHAYSPSSFRGPTSTAGGSSPSISGLRSFLDSEKGSSFAPTDTEEDNSDAEKPRNKRSRPSPPEERKAMGPPDAVSSAKGKEKVKWSRKTKAATNPDGEGVPAAEESERAPRKPRKSMAKRGVKRVRTTEAVTVAQEDEPLSKKLKAHLTAPAQLSPEKPSPS